MLRTIRTRAALGIVAALALILLPLATQAATINIILSGMDVQYFDGAAGNTGSIYDSIGHPGGNQNSAEADEVSNTLFQIDMMDLGTLMSSAGDRLYGDLRIDGVGSPLPLGFHSNIGSNGGGFGFDWFTDAGHELRLGIDTVDLFLTNNVLFFTGTATLLGNHSLPFNLEFTTNVVTFSYTATLVSVMGSPATSAMARGALTITGEGQVIPEPATIGLFCVGALLTGFALRRRRIGG